MEVLWNKKLRTTAGYCYYVGTSSSRVARIELSCKVVDSYGMVMFNLVMARCLWLVESFVVVLGIVFTASILRQTDAIARCEYWNRDLS